MTSPIWHPFTQHALLPEMTKITRAEGTYLYTPEGKRIIDAISSWWVVTHGHCHPRLVEAAREQAGTECLQLPQLLLGWEVPDLGEAVTGEPAERAAESRRFSLSEYRRLMSSLPTTLWINHW